MQDQISAGRTVSASTLGFWFAQPDAPRNALFASGDSSTWTDIVHRVVAYVENHSKYADKRAVVWGNGAGFDCNILRSFIESAPGYSREAPFKYADDRDVRTVLDLSPESKNVPPPNEFVKHDALCDAVYEALMVCDALRRINNRVAERIRPLGELIGEYEVELKVIADAELTSNEATKR